MGDMISHAERPKPGSRAAIVAGCTCPVIYNHYGDGRRGMGWIYGWLYDWFCPLHCESKPATVEPSENE